MIKTIPSKFPQVKNSAKKLEYPVANENFIRLNEKLSKTKDLDFYLGVCGGGTQNLFLLSLLLNGNTLKTIELLDINKEQLSNFTYIVKAHNNSRGDLQYLSNIIKNYQRFKVKIGDVPYWLFFAEMFRHKSYGFEETNFKRYPINKNIKIELIEKDILKHIKTMKLKKGTYFIYLSNVITYLKMPYSLKLRHFLYKLKNLKKIRDKDYAQNTYLEYTKSVLTPLIVNNENILDGSLVLVVIGFKLKEKIRIVLFKKKNKFLSIISKFNNV